MSIDGTISGSFVVNDRRTVGIGTAGNLPTSRSPSTAFTDGVGALQANVLYDKTQALTSGAYSLDLYGALSDHYGSSVTAARIKGIYLKNLSSSNNMVFGADGTAPWVGLLNSTGTITLKPGDWIIAASPTAAGWVVTATTGDILKVAGTGTDTFEVAFVGGLT